MREILFRGKRIDNGEWVEGSFLLDGEAHRPLDKDHLPFSNRYIVPETDLENIDTVFNDGSYYLRTEGYHVIPETVGQFTGLTAHGKKIFEGDLMEFEAYGILYRGVVTIEGGNTGVFCKGGSPFLDDTIKRYDAVKIGNIHDNPELLEVE